MIATESRGKVFGGLVRYLQAGRDGQHPERVEWSSTRNIRSRASRLDKVMERASTRNPRVRKPVVHWTISLAPGEHLTQVQWNATIDRVLKSMGLEEHLALVYAHNDRRHEHVHVVVNAVHPVTGEPWDSSYSKLRMNAVVAEIEQDHGLTIATRAPANARISWSVEDQAFAIAEHLIENNVSFTEEELRVWAEWRDRGEEIVRMVLDDPRLQPLRLEDGSYRYASQEYLDQEAAVFAGAEQLVARNAHTVATPEVQRLDPHQAAGLTHLLEGPDLAILVGRAGTGKTTMLKPAVDAWEEAGYRVIGAALAGKAADGLGRETEIESRTLDSWKMSWQAGYHELDADTVLLIDEAGMVDTAHLADVVDRAEQAGAKVVLIGDPDQLQSVAPGSPLRVLADRHGASYLETIWRQHEPWQRAATLDLANGQVGTAIEAYTERGGVQWTDQRETARESLVHEYLFDRTAAPDGSQVVLSYRNDEVAALNKAIRAGMVAEGHIEGGHLVAGRRWSEGDRLIFLKNDHRQHAVKVTEGDTARGVSNGTLATVETARDGGVVARLDDGRRVSFDPSSYSNYDYGYAATVHRSQGMTVDRTYVLADNLLDRNAAYVALSRHRISVSVHADTETLQSPEHLVKRWSRGHDHQLIAELKLDTPHPHLEQAVAANLRGEMTEEQREEFFRDARSVEFKTPEASMADVQQTVGPTMTDEEFAVDARPVGFKTAEESMADVRQTIGPTMTDDEFAVDARPVEFKTFEESMADVRQTVGPTMTDEEFAIDVRPVEFKTAEASMADVRQTIGPTMTDEEFAVDARPVEYKTTEESLAAFRGDSVLSEADWKHQFEEKFAALRERPFDPSGFLSPSESVGHLAHDETISLSHELRSDLGRIASEGGSGEELSRRLADLHGAIQSPVEAAHVARLQLHLAEALGAPTVERPEVEVHPEVAPSDSSPRLAVSRDVPRDEVLAGLRQTVDSPEVPVTSLRDEHPSMKLELSEDQVSHLSARVQLAASQSGVPEELAEKLRSLPLAPGQEQKAARSLADIQAAVEKPEHAALVAGLQVQLPVIYDREADQFHVTPSDLNGEVVASLVRDAALLAARSETESEVGKLSNLHRRAEYDVANLERQEGAAERSQKRLADSLVPTYADAQAAAAALSAYSHEVGVREAIRRLEEDPAAFGETRSRFFREARVAEDSAVRRELGRPSTVGDLATAVSNVRRLDAKLATTRQILSGMEPQAVVSSRLRAHTKGFATKMAMRAVVAVLPPPLKAPVLLAYHGARLGKKVAESVLQVKHRL